MGTPHTGPSHSGVPARRRMAAVLVGLLVWAGTAHADRFAGGTGEPIDPYQVATAEQLIAIGQDAALEAKHFILTADIDLSGLSFSEAVIPRLSGSLRGHNHTIHGMTIQGGDTVGLIGELLSGGLVENLDLQMVDIAGGQFVGGLAGWNRGGTLSGCHTSGIVKGDDRSVGGLVGSNGGRLLDCRSTCAVHGKGAVGGLVGSNSTYVMDCHSGGSVRGGGQTGGLVGVNNGFVGASSSGSSVVGTGDEVGGLIGINYACVFCSGATGAVEGNEHVGGLLGRQEYNARAINCYSTASVSGVDGVGGLAGTSIGSIAFCHSAGPVTADGPYVGGLVGSGWERVVACFWDVDTSGQAHSMGGTGLNTQQSGDVYTYLAEGWDFTDEAANGLSEIWTMPEQGGAPVLDSSDRRRPSSLAGEGTAEAPYLLATALDLGSVWRHPFASYRLAASLDLSDIRWSGSVIPLFAGTFDGNDLAIRRLAVEGDSGVGLFGALTSSSVVTGLALEDVNVAAGSLTVGALAGENSGRIRNCRVAGSVRGSSEVGGLVGLNDSYSELSECHSECTVTGVSEVGGLAGLNWGTVTLCSSAGETRGSIRVGGLIGENHSRVSDCRSSSSVAGGGDDMGGLVGLNYGRITACASTGRVQGRGRVGGLLGSHHRWGSQADYGVVADSMSSGEVSGEALIGGLIGSSDGLVTACYSTGSVHGADKWVGGLVGRNDYDGSIVDCYSRGNVGGTAESVGGLVGDNNWGSVANCYSTGSVVGRSEVGGLVGSHLGSASCVTGCFWDVNTSGLTISFGGTGLSTARMKDFFTFLAAGWDFVGESKNGADDVWIGMINDYPQLRWQHGK